MHAAADGRWAAVRGDAPWAVARGDGRGDGRSPPAACHPRPTGPSATELLASQMNANYRFGFRQAAGGVAGLAGGEGASRLSTKHRTSGVEVAAARFQVKRRGGRRARAGDGWRLGGGRAVPGRAARGSAREGWRRAASRWRPRGRRSSGACGRRARAGDGQRRGTRRSPPPPPFPAALVRATLADRSFRARRPFRARHHTTPVFLSTASASGLVPHRRRLGLRLVPPRAARRSSPSPTPHTSRPRAVAIFPSPRRRPP
uniref:Uncharacterized protein n=1 Tax=Oryza nivara TaxID=4536 RepID=A0A0E0GS29_ORYNI